MRAISITQPWATLIACGAKRLETRDWPTRWIRSGETVAIHATKGCETDVLDDEYFKDALYAARQFGYWESDGALPLGAVIAIARFVRCCHVESLDFERMSVEEYAFGNFSHGRFAIQFAHVQPILPQPAIGRLGWWDWTPSANYEQSLILQAPPVKMPAPAAPADISLSRLHLDGMARRMALTRSQDKRKKPPVDEHWRKEFEASLWDN